VSLVDVLPTVLDWAGTDYDEKKIDGISLTSYLRGGEQPEKSSSRIFLSELGDRKALTDSNLKYIYNLDRQNEELYNLAKDPGETRTIIEEKAKRASRYKKLILRIIKRMQLSYDEKTLSEDERKNLESLSYIN
jgi:arylsulfatase A-like enzyme